MRDLIIIGGGPAGITAGIYAVRWQLKTLLITKEFGGQMARKTVAIENYPGFEQISGRDLIKKFETHLRKQKDIKIEIDKIAEIEKRGQVFFVSTEGKKEFKAKAVIIASGADPRPLEVPGEKEFIGRGVSYCTACDGPVFADKIVAVIGGGDSGFEAALFLANIAKKVYILEQGSKVRADQDNQEKTKQSNKIQIITSAALKEIKGKEFVESIDYYEKDSQHVRHRVSNIKVDGVFVEIGSIPATSFVKGLVDFNKRDEIKIEPKTLSTKTPGLFAAGDVTDIEAKQIITAAGQGCAAAFSVYKYLQ